MAGGEDDGYFPQGSMLRQVMSERLVGLFYGQRALMIGALYPPNFVGTLMHSAGRAQPFKRLARTGKAFESIYFGPRTEADRVLRSVRSMHEHVKGELIEDAGPFPAGTPYSALDPALMWWTVAVMVDSSACFYELFIRRLEPDERERLYADWVRFGELFDMPADAAPDDYSDFRRWYADRLASDQMHLTDEARFIGHATALEIPFRRWQGGAKRLHDLIMLGSLPPRVRGHYGLEWSARQAIAFRAAIRAIRTPRPLLPHGITNGRNTRSFDDVAAEEQRRIDAGEYTPQIVD